MKAFHISLRLVKKTMVLPLLRSLWSDDQGQDIAEYAVMLAVILVIVGWHDPNDWKQRQYGVLFRGEFYSVNTSPGSMPA